MLRKKKADCSECTNSPEKDAPKNSACQHGEAPTTGNCESKEEEAFHYLQDLFIDKIDPDVIHMVLSECDFRVDDAVETLFMLASHVTCDSHEEQSKKDVPANFQVPEQDLENMGNLNSKSKSASAYSGHCTQVSDRFEDKRQSQYSDLDLNSGLSMRDEIYHSNEDLYNEDTAGIGDGLRQKTNTMLSPESITLSSFSSPNLESDVTGNKSTSDSDSLKSPQDEASRLKFSSNFQPYTSPTRKHNFDASCCEISRQCSNSTNQYGAKDSDCSVKDSITTVNITEELCIDTLVAEKKDEAALLSGTKHIPDLTHHAPSFLNSHGSSHCSDTNKDSVLDSKSQETDSILSYVHRSTPFPKEEENKKCVLQLNPSANEFIPKSPQTNRKPLIPSQTSAFHQLGSKTSPRCSSASSCKSGFPPHLFSVPFNSKMHVLPTFFIDYSHGSVLQFKDSFPKKFYSRIPKTQSFPPDFPPLFSSISQSASWSECKKNNKINKQEMASKKQTCKDLTNISNNPSQTKTKSSNCKASPKKEPLKLNSKELILEKIRKGEKIMIVLRGCPGSGKSTLAKEIWKLKGCILSTDDYFMKRGKYNYDYTRLSDAHEWNKNRAKKAISDQKNPIIIDNTNIEVWEMKPYVIMGLQSGYQVEILEPDTPWKFKPSELARRNHHGVSMERIVRMLDRYERNVSVDSILRGSSKLPVKVAEKGPQQKDRLCCSQENSFASKQNINFKKKSPRKHKTNSKTPQKSSCDHSKFLPKEENEEKIGTSIFLAESLSDNEEVNGESEEFQNLIDFSSDNELTRSDSNVSNELVVNNENDTDDKDELEELANEEVAQITEKSEKLDQYNWSKNDDKVLVYGHNDKINDESSYWEKSSQPDGNYDWSESLSVPKLSRSRRKISKYAQAAKQEEKREESEQSNEEIACWESVGDEVEWVKSPPKAQRIKKRLQNWKNRNEEKVYLHPPSDIWKIPELPASRDISDIVCLKNSPGGLAAIDAWTITDPMDFSLLYKVQRNEIDASHLRVMIARDSFSVEKGLDCVVANNYLREILMLDKGCLTDIEDETEDLSFLQNCFPKISIEDLQDVVDKCKGNIQWTINILLDSEYTFNQTSLPATHCKTTVISNDISPDDDMPISGNSGQESEEGLCSDIGASSPNIPEELPLEIQVHDVVERNQRVENWDQEKRYLNKFSKTCSPGLSSVTKRGKNGDEVVASVQRENSCDSGVALSVQSFAEYSSQTTYDHRGFEFQDDSRNTSAEASQSSETASPNITVEGISYSPNSHFNKTVMDLRLDPEFAFALQKMFGPPDFQLVPEILSSEDLTIKIDANLAQQLHKQWSRTLRAKFEREQDDLEHMLRQGARSSSFPRAYNK